MGNRTVENQNSKKNSEPRLDGVVLLYVYGVQTCFYF